MVRLALLLLPSVLLASPPRYARLGEFQGAVEVQLTAADAWIPAARNLPLMESTWLRTGPGSRVEIELDEGNALRLGPDSQAGLADYKRLSTGQRVTLLTIDRGTAYFTGIAEGADALMLAVPGAQVTAGRGTRLRFEVQEQWSQIAVIEGVVRFSSPAAEMDIREGQTTRVEAANPARFFLNRDVAPMDLDRWSEVRDQALSSSTSSTHVLHRYGLVDLDAAGEWIQTEDLGAVWRPKTEEGWRPFQNGRWRWYDSLGYTWVSDEPWGWLPYHHGRWQRRENLGWIWAPSKSAVFKPGDVYWLRGAKLAGWGPLGPGESWPAPENQHPWQYLIANTVWSAFGPDAKVLDPAGFPAPKEPLAVAAFTEALPSPAFPASKLEFNRPLVRAGRGRVMPVVDGVTFDGATAPQPPPAPAPPIVITESPAPPPPPPEVAYPPPVIVPPPILIVNVPGNPDYSSRRPRPTPAGAQKQPPSQSQNTTPPPTTPVSTAPPSPSRGQGAAGKLPQIPVGNTPPREQPPGNSDRTPVPTPRLPRAEGPTAPREGAPSGSRNPPTAPAKKFRDAGESQLVNEVVKNIAGLHYSQALASLEQWSRRYAKSDFSDDRAYYYMQAYTGLNQPAKVVETGAPLLAKNLAAVFQDPMQIVGVLYLASFNLQQIEHPTRAQLAAGRTAAAELLEYLPACFAASNKPPAVTAENWAKARTDMETIARQTLAR